MKALTIKAPWAWAIVHAGKDVENRTWSTNYRGPLAIHSAAGLDRRYDQWAREWMQRIGVEVPRDLALGAVVGVVDVVDCVRDSGSDWGMADNNWHWLLANPRAIEPVPCVGRLQLWEWLPCAVKASATHVQRIHRGG